MNTSHPRRIGIQTQPATQGQPFPHGSFHEAAARELYSKPLSSGDDTFSKELVCYRTHEEMIVGLENGEIDEAVIAIDNTHSGRVVSAIDALRERKLRIIDKIAIPVSQHVLFHKDLPLDSATHVMSQAPALNQALAWIRQHNLWAVEHHDTVDAARLVGKGRGIINGNPTVAIASKLAGKANGLMVGEQVSPRGNATTFWRIVRHNSTPKLMPKDDSGQRMAALSFVPPQRRGSLLKIVEQLSSNDLNFADIDSHLHRHGHKRGFFAEIELGRRTEADLKNILQDFLEPYAITVNGVYQDRTLTTVKKTMSMRAFMGDASSGTILPHRKALMSEHSARVLYVQATNHVGSLASILRALENVNILDMSRPLVPEHSSGRGFFFILPADADTVMIERLLHENMTYRWYAYNELTK